MIDSGPDRARSLIDRQGSYPMSDIVLSSGVRSNLLNLQQTSDLITSTQNKLASGKRVNSALDNPNNFFTAQGLNNRASDLSGLLDSMSTAINTIQAANNGITAITKLVQSAQSLISQANQTADTTVRANLAAQFDSIRTQIDQLASDSGLNGVNLLAGQNLTVNLNENGTSTTTVNAVDDSTSGALAISASANSWATSADITASATELTAALTTLRSQGQALSGNLQIVQVRQDFTKAMINTLQTGADNLTLADSNQEGANLLALQTRQQLSTTALSLASQADKNVLKLFQ
jgi:flagellin-like hook-associated protein FlgL